MGDHAMMDRLRDWLVEHLPAVVIVLLVLWAPPLIFNVLVNLKIVAGAGSGYPSFRDPSLLLGLLQVLLMIAAVPPLAARLERGWHLLAAACAIWLVHAAWTIQGRLRLSGLRDLASRETLVTLAALIVSAAIVAIVRQRFTRRGAVALRGAAAHEPPQRSMS